LTLISNDEELRAALDRVERLRQQVIELRRVETNPTNYRLSADGYLAEIDRMSLEIRGYLSIHPSNVTHGEDTPLNTTLIDRTQFFVQAQVSIAKSAVMLASAEIDFSGDNLIPCAVNAYYSFFHLAMAVMWLLPERMPASLYRTVSDIEASGMDLPSKKIPHGAVEDFFCKNGQANLSVSDSRRLYRLALRLREAASYEPRVKRDGQSWVVGDCSLQPAQIHEVVTQLPRMFTEVLQEVRTQTDDISLALMALDGARGLLKRKDLPFKGGYPERVLVRAEALIKELVQPVGHN
jgi:hypothetical protein